MRTLVLLEKSKQGDASCGSSCSGGALLFAFYLQLSGQLKDNQSVRKQKGKCTLLMANNVDCHFDSAAQNHNISSVYLHLCKQSDDSDHILSVRKPALVTIKPVLLHLLYHKTSLSVM